MKIANIYDKQLQAIEEAEEKVRIAKTNLLEAERELDETLALVESELDENLFDDEGNDPEYIIEVLQIVGFMLVRKLKKEKVLFIL